MGGWFTATFKIECQLTTTKTAEETHKTMKTITKPQVIVGATDEFAKRLFTPKGTDHLNAEVLAKSKVLNLDLKKVPKIPFTNAELERAQELGQFLVYHSDQMKDGQPFTMKALHDESENKLGEGKLFYDTGWYQKEPLFTEDKIVPGWYLVGLDVIPDSTNKDYLGQTQVIADYLVEQVYKEEELPPAYQSAIKEWVNKHDVLEKLVRKDWQEGAKQASELQINQLFRESAVQAAYNNTAYFEVNGKYLLPKVWTWTRTRSSDSGLVLVGGADADGLSVRRDGPRGSDDDPGARFFRGVIPNLES